MDSSSKQAASVSSEPSSLASASFRVYYSLRAGAVPFLWESAPGTPKCGAVSRLEDSSLPVGGGAGASTTTTMLLLPPPISPPPSCSYQPSSRTKRRSRRPSSWTTGGLVRALLGVLGLRKSRSSQRPASSSYL